jgi:hypothetical protein
MKCGTCGAYAPWGVKTAGTDEVGACLDHLPDQLCNRGTYLVTRYPKHDAVAWQSGICPCLACRVPGESP